MNQLEKHTVLSEKEIEIAKVIFHVNQLSNYPLGVPQIEDWSKSIEDIVPNLEIDDLKYLIKCFKIGEEHYDYKLGIQNIFIGLRNRFGGKYFKTKPVY